jgi:hypothetical protein
MDPTVSPTGAATALGEILKNKYVAAVFAVLCVVAGYVMFNLEDFPKWCKSPCGIILALAAVSSFYSVGARKMLALGLISWTLMVSRPAQAQSLSLGPAAPLMAITPGDKQPVAFSPGTGFSVGCDLFSTKLNNHPVYWLSPGVSILGTASSNGTTTALGISAAFYVAILQLVTIGVGAPLIDSLNNGLFQHPDKRTPFITFGLDHGFGTFLNALGIGHTPPAPVQQACDGDHPCAVPVLDESTLP